MNKQHKKSKAGGGVGILEIILFVVWLVVAAGAGYYLGHPPPEPCTTTAHHHQATQAPVKIEPSAASLVDKPKCIPTAKPAVPDSSSKSVTTSAHKHHNSLEHLKREWECARADLPSAHEVSVKPLDGSLAKTKWNSIMSFSPKQFFERYLAQYPVDLVSHQPVVVMSHKPLNSFDDLPESCKVMDIAIVPDEDDVCVAVTETFHDVASYHMLHAERNPQSGKFSWRPNSIAARTLPSEENYEAARKLFSDYFDHMTYVETELRAIPRFREKKTAVATLIEEVEQVELFKNSIASATRAGVQKTKFCIITTSDAVRDAFNNFGVKLIFLSKLNSIGHHQGVSKAMRSNFIQVWLAYACTNKGVRVTWQSPGTVWLDRPDNVVGAAPDVESFWAYRGHYDEKAGPFYSTFDFVGFGVDDRPIHLTHEFILHFELALAWNSMDAMVSYRLVENNARYGTSMYMMPPLKVLHTDLLNNDPVPIYAAVSSDDPPMVVTLGYNMPAAEAKTLLVNCGLWFIK